MSLFAVAWKWILWLITLLYMICLMIYFLICKIWAVLKHLWTKVFGKGQRARHRKISLGDEDIDEGIAPKQKETIMAKGHRAHHRKNSHGNEDIDERIAPKLKETILVFFDPLRTKIWGFITLRRIPNREIWGFITLRWIPKREILAFFNPLRTKIWGFITLRWIPKREIWGFITLRWIPKREIWEFITLPWIPKREVMGKGHRARHRKNSHGNDDIDGWIPLKMKDLSPQTIRQLINVVSSRKVVCIFSRDGAECYDFLSKALELQDSLVSEVWTHTITNSGWGGFYDNISGCDFAILYHTKNRGRVNITNVTDSLYDEELKTLSQTLGKEKVLVVVDDLESTTEADKERIISQQTLIQEKARDLILFNRNKNTYEIETREKIKQILSYIKRA